MSGPTAWMTSATPSRSPATTQSNTAYPSPDSSTLAPATLSLLPLDQPSPPATPRARTVPSPSTPFQSLRAQLAQRAVPASPSITTLPTTTSTPQQPTISPNATHSTDTMPTAWIPLLTKP